MRTVVRMLGCVKQVGSIGLLLVLVAFVLASCGGQAAPVGEGVGSSSEAIALRGALTPTKATVVVGGTQQFRPESGSFGVSDLTVASISASGLLTAIAPGVVTVTRTQGAKVETATVSVVQAKLTAIDVTCGGTTTTGLGKTARVTVIGVGDVQACAVMGSYAVPGVAKAETATIPNANVTWSSDRPASATVSAAGIVQAIAPGKLLIVATDPATGIHGGIRITVDAQPIATVNVTPAITSIPASTGVQFKATAQRTNTKARGGTTTPVDVVWSVADPSIASVDATGFAQGLAVGTTTVTALEPTTGIKGKATLTVTGRTLTSIAIEPAGAPITTGTRFGSPLPSVLGAGETLALEAIGLYRDARGIQRARLAPATTLWSSSNASLATVSADGVVAGVSPATGKVTITATDAITGQHGRVTFEMTPRALKSLAITPGKASLMQLPAGIDVPLTLTATFVGGRAPIKIDETAHAAWTSSKAKVAVASNLPGSAGVLTTMADGQATITATFGGLQATANVTVVGTWTLLAIDIAPPSQRLPAGTTSGLVATGVFQTKGARGLQSQMTRDVTDVVTWVSSSAGVAVSNTPGSKGRITALGEGPATITVEDPGSKVTGKASVLVTGATVQSIAITPPRPTIAARTSAQLEATATLSDGTVRDVTASVVWTTTNPAVATISNATKSAGLASGLAVGTTLIGAADPSSGVIAPDVLLTVGGVALTRLSINPATASIANGLTQRFQAIGTYSNGSTKDLTSSVVWSVTSGTATISNAASSPGVATSDGVGPSAILAVDSTTGLTATATLNVTAATLVSIAVTPALPSRPLGLTAQFTATGKYTDGSTQDLTQSVAWTTSTGAASISNATGSAGLATALALGQALITATEGTAGISGATTFTVTAAVLRSLAVAPLAASVPAGLTQQYSATGTYTDGSTYDVTASVVWASTAPAVFTVSNGADDAGLGSALAAGVATISATDPSTLLGSSTTVTVTSPLLQSIMVNVDLPSLVVGTSEQLTATGTYSDGSTADVTQSVSWASSSPDVVSVSSAGFADAIAPGDTMVTATDPGGVVGSAQISAVTTSCGEGLTLCGEECVDENSDPNNCGACNKFCDGPQVACSAGACAFPVSVTFDVEFACAEVSFDFDLIDDVETVSVTGALGTCAAAPYCEAQCPSCGGTVTFPTPLPAGSTYNITTSGSCTFSDGGGPSASGVVTGPVTLTATCRVDNC